MNVCGVKTSRREHVLIHRGTKSEVASDADSHRAELARACRIRFEVIERGARIGVVGGKFFADLACVPAVGTGLIVGKHSARRLKLVINFGHVDLVAVPG